MSAHFGEIDTNNVAVRFVLAPSLEWCTNNLGGTWVQTCNRNPTENDPAAADPKFEFHRYGGIGMLSTFGAPEIFIPTDSDNEVPEIDLSDADAILQDDEDNNLTDSEGSLLHKYQRTSPDDLGAIYRYPVDGELYRVAAPLGQYCSSADVPGVSTRWQLVTVHTSGWGKWAQPGSWYPYPVGWVCYYEPGDQHYRNDLGTPNVNVPGTLNSGWTEVQEDGTDYPAPEYRTWEPQPDPLYVQNEIAFYETDSKFWVSLFGNNGNPPAAGWWTGPYDTLEDAVAAGGVVV